MGMGATPDLAASAADLLLFSRIHSQTAVRQGGLAAAGVGNAAMQEE